MQLRYWPKEFERWFNPSRALWSGGRDEEGDTLDTKTTSLFSWLLFSFSGTFDSAYLYSCAVSTLCNKIKICTGPANRKLPKSCLLEINSAPDASDRGEVSDMDDVWFNSCCTDEIVHFTTQFFVTGVRLCKTVPLGKIELHIFLHHLWFVQLCCQLLNKILKNIQLLPIRACTLCVLISTFSS